MTAKPLVTLHDGRVVDTWSEEWRAECEARAVLRMRSKGDRYAWLNAVENRRGKAARDALHARVLAIWRAGNVRQDDGDNDY